MLSLLLLLACETSSSSGTASCSLGKPVLDRAEAAHGDTVTLTAAPLSEAWDTAVTVGSARATGIEVDRASCDACDDCKDTGECAVCGETCATCAEPCASCTETLRFVVPDVPAGDWTVQIINRYGRSEGVTLTVTAPATDTAPTDTAPTDTAISTP